MMHFGQLCDILNISGGHFFLFFFLGGGGGGGGGGDNIKYFVGILE